MYGALVETVKLLNKMKRDLTYTHIFGDTVLVFNHGALKFRNPICWVGDHSSRPHDAFFLRPTIRFFGWGTTFRDLTMPFCLRPGNHLFGCRTIF